MIEGSTRWWYGKCIKDGLQIAYAGVLEADVERISGDPAFAGGQWHWQRGCIVLPWGSHLIGSEDIEVDQLRALLTAPPA